MSRNWSTLIIGWVLLLGMGNTLAQLHPWLAWGSLVFMVLWTYTLIVFGRRTPQVAGRVAGWGLRGLWAILISVLRLVLQTLAHLVDGVLNTAPRR